MDYFFASSFSSFWNGGGIVNEKENTHTHKHVRKRIWNSQINEREGEIYVNIFD
jgi:hypothetical protein